MKFLQSILEKRGASIGLDRETEFGEMPVLWSNGLLTYNPTQMERLLNMQTGGTGVFLNMKKKTITTMTGDDYSELKMIKKIQSALGDIKKDGIITDKWIVRMGNDPKNTKLSLGSNTVKGVLAHDSNFQKSIPRVFHGTSSHYLEEIEKYGLKGYLEDSDKNVYLTFDYERANYYAQTSVELLKEHGIESKPIIIEMHDFPVDLIIKDDDYKRTIGIMQLISFTSGGNAKDTLQQSIRHTSQFATKGVINPKLFKKIHKLK